MLSNIELHYVTDAEVLVKAGKPPSGPNIRVRFWRATRGRRRFQTCKPLVARHPSAKKPKYIILLKYWRPVRCQIMHLWTVRMDYQLSADTRVGRLLEQDLLISPLFRAASTPQRLLRLMHKSGDTRPARTLRSSGADAGSGRAGCRTPLLWWRQSPARGGWSNSCLSAWRKKEILV